MAVTEVARIRSSVSGNVVNSSRGNPEKEDPVVLRTTRPSIPAQVRSPPAPERVTSTRDVRRSDPPPMNPLAPARAQSRCEIETLAPVTPHDSGNDHSRRRRSPRVGVRCS